MRSSAALRVNANQQFEVTLARHVLRGGGNGVRAALPATVRRKRQRLTGLMWELPASQVNSHDARPGCHGQHNGDGERQLHRLVKN
jgi:hypothetical protein